MSTDETTDATFDETRCWPYAGEEDRRYHDTEWGVPVHDDTRMFEHLSLECLQCGLTWNYVLQRRDLFRTCFRGFDIDAVAAMSDAEVEGLLERPGMLRNRGKLRAIVNNARASQTLRDEFGSLCAYFWSWTDGKTLLYEGHQEGAIPANNGLSARIAKDLKRRGFKFVGPTNIYAHLQSCGLVCDHGGRCPRYAYVVEHHPCARVPRDEE